MHCYINDIDIPIALGIFAITGIVKPMQNLNAEKSWKLLAKAMEIERRHWIINMMTYVLRFPNLLIDKLKVDVK